jgi:hypothetical protein
MGGVIHYIYNRHDFNHGRMLKKLYKIADARPGNG